PTSPSNTGHRKLRLRLLHDARRQAINGPTPIRNRSTSPSGAFTRLKNGGPTVIFTPRTASEITGKIVPQNTANAIPTRIKLLSRKAASRERIESNSFSLRSSGNRQSTKLNDRTIIPPRNHMKNGPRPDCVNECTEEITPLRVKKVPKMVRAKVRSTSTTFHTRSMSFFSWIITEWR